MTVIMAIAGWVIFSAVCSPLIGYLLYTLNQDETSRAPRSAMRAPLSSRSARRDSAHRRSYLNVWPRKASGQSKAG